LLPHDSSMIWSHQSLQIIQQSCEVTEFMVQILYHCKMYTTLAIWNLKTLFKIYEPLNTTILIPLQTALLTCVASTIPHRSCYMFIIKHNTITYYNKCSLTCSCNMVICDKSKFQSVIQHWIKPILKVFSLFMRCHQCKLRCIWSNSILVWNNQSKTSIRGLINSTWESNTDVQDKLKYWVIYNRTGCYLNAY
jgi:hypothetical protein